MTTPADNTDRLDWSISKVLRKPGSYPDDWYGQYIVYNSASQTVNIRPESISNPIRPDGTRQPSGWEHVWGQASLPFGRPHWLKMGGWPGFYEFKADGAISFLPPSFSLEGMCLQSGARWASTGNDLHFPADVENMARTNLLNKVASSKASLGSALTEFRGSVDTVTAAAEYIADAARAIAWRTRGSVADVVSALRDGVGQLRPSTELGHDITRLWIEKQYGLRPLIQDIDDAGQALSDAIFERDQAFLLLARSGAVVTNASEAIFSAPEESLWGVRVPVQVSTGCHYTAVYEIPRVSDRHYQQSGLGNVPAAWWEAVRWSFAIDHVLNSGKWLNSLMAVDGLRFREGSRSRIQRAWLARNDVLTCIPASPSVRLSSDFDQIHATLSYGRFKRTVVANGVFPAFMPSVKKRLGLEFMSNILSIISTMAVDRSGRRFK